LDNLLLFYQKVKFLGAEKFLIKVLVFKSYKFLKRQLRLEQWQKSLAGTWGSETLFGVENAKWKENQPNF
jgi:hypothetical protein